MIVIAGVTVTNVVARNLTGESLAFAEELNQFLIVMVCFVGLSYAAGKGRHIRMTAISDLLPDGARRILMIFVTSTTAALLFTLCWYAFHYALGVDRRSPVLDVPYSWVYMIAPIGLGLGGLQYALAAWRNLSSSEVYIAYDQLEGCEPLELETNSESES